MITMFTHYYIYVCSCFTKKKTSSKYLIFTFTKEKRKTKLLQKNRTCIIFKIDNAQAFISYHFNMYWMTPAQNKWTYHHHPNPITSNKKELPYTCRYVYFGLQYLHNVHILYIYGSFIVLFPITSYVYIMDSCVCIVYLYLT